MSNRFHSKFHRQNHHTYTRDENPDAGHDPIASPEQPFYGDFVLFGGLSCVAPASSYAGYFYSDNTALCAYAGDQGAYICSYGDMGLQVYSMNNIGISAYGLHYGEKLYSFNTGLYSYGYVYGIDTYSDGTGFNSYGGLVGGIINSPHIGLSANGDDVGIQVFSQNIALSAYGLENGIYAYSPNYAMISYSDNYGSTNYGGILGGSFDSANIGLSAGGDNNAIYAVSPKLGISTKSDNLALYAYSPLTGIRTFGGSVGGIFESNNIALSTGGGINIFDSRVGIFTDPSTYEFNVLGDSKLTGAVDINTSTINAVVNINTGTNSSALNIGNYSGNTNVYANKFYLESNGDVNINETTANVTNINTGTGNVKTSIGNVGTVSIKGVENDITATTNNITAITNNISANVNNISANVNNINALSQHNIYGDVYSNNDIHLVNSTLYIDVNKTSYSQFVFNDNIVNNQYKFYVAGGYFSASVQPTGGTLSRFIDIDNQGNMFSQSATAYNDDTSILNYKANRDKLQTYFDPRYDARYAYKPIYSTTVINTSANKTNSTSTMYDVVSCNIPVAGMYYFNSTILINYTQTTGSAEGVNVYYSYPSTDYFNIDGEITLLGSSAPNSNLTPSAGNTSIKSVVYDTAGQTLTGNIAFPSGPSVSRNVLFTLPESISTSNYVYFATSGFLHATAGGIFVIFSTKNADPSGLNGTITNTSGNLFIRRID